MRRREGRDYGRILWGLVIYTRLTVRSVDPPLLMAQNGNQEVEIELGTDEENGVNNATPESRHGQS
jgi:hypothetical protein